MYLKPIATAIMTLSLLGCMSTPTIDQDYRDKVESPAQWQSQTEIKPVQDNWLSQLDDEQVLSLVNLALSNNYQLRQQKQDIEIAKQQLIVAGSNLWPSLDLSLDSSRRKNGTTEVIGNSHGLTANIRYELDLWGKLSDNERQANLDLLAKQASYEQAKQNLVAQVVTTWFAVIEANKQLSLRNERLVIAGQNLEIIEAGYRQGLNNALDVYLTRNEHNSEKARVAQQQTTQIQQIRKLERLVGEYPAGLLSVTADLPLLTTSIPLGLPSELISRKPSLVASWYQLLASDAGLAYAHKQRFPSLSLSGSLGTSSDDLGDLLSANTLGWSLISSLSAPIFNAGRLSANEEKAKLQLAKQELVYLDTLQQAFEVVENSVTAEVGLQSRYNNTLTAAENAKLAETLSFEQYQKGLVSYTTVLDAQKRSFDAQSSLITIKNQLIANRINLHLALGGDFAPSQSRDSIND